VSARRLGTITAGAALVAATLSGCSAIDALSGTGVARNGDGAVTTQSEADAFDLRVGDCIDDNGNASQITSVVILPCKEQHRYEAYATMQLEDGDYPGSDAIVAQADEFCASEFQRFAGIGYDDSALDYTYFYPTSQSWSQGDREVLCLIGDPTGDVSGTLKDAER